MGLANEALQLEGGHLVRVRARVRVRVRVRVRTKPCSLRAGTW